jgi:D-3-phosphoglycerate dehydrogenase
MRKARALYYSILRYQAENRARLGELFDVVELPDPRNDTEEVLSAVQVLFAPLGYYVSADKITRCPQLRVVVSNTTGIAHIDAAAAARRNVLICALHNQPEFLERITPTAEHTIALMLAVWRKLPAAHRAASAGQWDRRPWGAPKMMSRMRLGLVGYGRLGRRVGRTARAMDMHVDFYDPAVAGSQATLLGLARQSDVLSIHAPVTSENHGLVSREVLEALPSGSIVVNTARGELLDTGALLDLLERGHLRGAALDVIEGEYEPDFAAGFARSRVAEYARTHDNLILTPHIGGSTVDAWRETERHVIDQAERAMATL